MALEPVHVYVKDRATNRATLTHINPTRTFGVKSDSGISWYTWQNGDWYGMGGTPINEADVPAEFKASVRDTPFVDVELMNGPSVTKVCRFCGEKMNASQYEMHTEAHVDELLRGTATASAASAKTAAKQPEAPAAH